VRPGRQADFAGDRKVFGRGLYSSGQAANVGLALSVGASTMIDRQETRLTTAEAPENAAAAAWRAGALPVRFAPGDVIYRPGDPARRWIVLERGRVKVRRTADSGREVALYRIEAGESCMLTTPAMFSRESMLAEASPSCGRARRPGRAPRASPARRSHDGFCRCFGPLFPRKFAGIPL